MVHLREYVNMAVVWPKNQTRVKKQTVPSSVGLESEKTLGSDSDSPKEKGESGKESFEVVVSVVLCVRVKMEATKHLCDWHHGTRLATSWKCG